MAKMALSNAVLDGTAATDTLKSGDKIYCVTYVASTSDEVRSALKFGLRCVLFWTLDTGFFVHISLTF